MDKKQKELEKELSEILSEHSIELKFGRGYFKGGFCRYQDRQILYLNRSDSLESQIEIVLNELKSLDLDDEHIRSEIKGLLEEKE